MGGRVVHGACGAAVVVELCRSGALGAVADLSVGSGGAGAVVLRLPVVVLTVATVVLAAVIAHELGGGRAAQVAAALGYTCTPFAVEQSAALSTFAYDAVVLTMGTERDPAADRDLGGGPGAGLAVGAVPVAPGDAAVGGDAGGGTASVLLGDGCALFFATAAVHLVGTGPHDRVGKALAAYCAAGMSGRSGGVCFPYHRPGCTDPRSATATWQFALSSSDCAGGRNSPIPSPTPLTPCRRRNGPRW